MEPPEIVFKLQWKRKPGAGGREELASIGIWDMSDPTLDLIAFKSYLCQHLGTVADFSVSYMDNEGDELPIESDCEFQEALKFAKIQACKGQHTVLKLDKQSAPSSVALSSETKTLFGSRSRDWTFRSGHSRDWTFKSELRKDSCFPSMRPKYAYRAAGNAIVESDHTTHMVPIGPPYKFKFYKSGKDKSSSSEDKKKRWRFASELEEEPKAASQNVPELIRNQDQEQSRKQNIENDDNPPSWFKKYMQKMKMEIVGEVTANVLLATRQLMETKLCSPPCPCVNHPNNAWPTGKPKKKRISDEDSSDANINSHQREHKLLKKIEKLHKRERKLDSKLERLESKTKRRMEKKTQPKNRVETAVVERKSSRKRSSDGPVGTYLMDAILLNDGARPFEPLRTRPSERCTKVWEIMNNGTLPWTDKTELRLAWGTPCLEPEKSVVKCPILKPGEKGKIAVNFTIPDFPGTFESYWHFYHMGDRFGHWIDCAVIVECEDQKLTEEEALHAASAVVNKGTPSPQDSDNAMATNNNVLDGNLNLCEDGAGQVKASEGEKRSDNGEYESDSDSDNLSIISGSITISSDSDCDDNFVVVPMPAFFTYDSATDSTLQQEVDLPEQSIGKEVASISTAGETDKLLHGMSAISLLQNSEGEQPICDKSSVHFENVEGEQPICDKTIRHLQQYVEGEQPICGKNIRHLQQNIEGEQPICGKGVRHLQQHMEGEQPICGKTIRHLRQNIEGEQPICGKNIRHLQQHMEGEQPICGKGVRHLQHNMEGEQPICGKTIGHLQLNVEGEQPNCGKNIRHVQQNVQMEQPTCGKRFRHLQKNVEGEQPNSGKSFRHVQKNVEGEQPICEKTITHLQQNGEGEQPIGSKSVKHQQGTVPEHADKDLIDLEDNDNQRDKFEDALDDETLVERASKVYAVDPTGRCIPFEAAWSNTNHQSWMQYHHHDSGEQHRETTSKIYVNCSNQTSRSHSTSPPHASSPDPERSSPTRPLQQGSSVHILPETLVAGAINVASSAYSTARAVINNLRTIGDPVDPNLNQSRADAASSSTNDNLKLLLDMGFTNQMLNVLLLQRYDNNLIEVIQQLLMPPHSL